MRTTLGPATITRRLFLYLYISLNGFDKDLISAIVSTTMVIRMRHTRSHTANRRSHHALKAPTLGVCKNCGANYRPHHMCLSCGYYNGRQVIDLEAKKTAREARMNAKKEAIKGSAVGDESPVAEVEEKTEQK